ncbi:MAG TPA: hypothetical protein PLG17_10000, partial [Thermodesulfobacteriota bacterium]|nr:hypothetical protein [Thermodesulfobacteriota bacterium]
MLTAKAYQERKWRAFPALRKALEDKKVPDDYYGPTSVSDNMFARMDRLLEISVLVSEYQEHIKETAKSVGREEMYRDLRRLEEDLEQAAYFFKRQIEKVQTLYGTL